MVGWWPSARPSSPSYRPTRTPRIRAAELQRSRLEREREDLTAGKGRYRDHPVAHAIWELHQAEVNIARLERSLAESRLSRAIRKVWRAELAGWQSRSAPGPCRGGSQRP